MVANRDAKLPPRLESTAGFRVIAPDALAGAITAFAVLHGAGNGLLTIAKGTVPLAIFGPVGYGLRTGILGAPARATQAASPLLFGLLMDRMGIGVLAISAGLSLSALVALVLLKARPAPAPVAA